MLCCRALSPEQRSRYRELTGSQSEETVVVHLSQKVEVAHAHLATCARNCWLADPIMNVYVALLQARRHACSRRVTTHTTYSLSLAPCMYQSACVRSHPQCSF